MVNWFWYIGKIVSDLIIKNYISFLVSLFITVHNITATFLHLISEYCVEMKKCD